MKLYVIGNGFDIAHSLPCRFIDFYAYLQKHRKDVLSEMEEFYDISDNSELWSDFEVSLERDIVYDALADNIREYSPNIASDDFRDGDWYSAQIQIENDCDVLLNSMRSGFEEWISSLDIKKIKKRFEFNENSYFITFNYTEVLEHIYRIPTSNILHIHNKIGEELIFGHGKELTDFNVREALYGDENAFLVRDECGNIETNEIGHERYAESAVEAFYKKMQKDTNQIISSHAGFFKNISDVDEICVLGHSYNTIDFPYFEEIASSISKRSKWSLTYFNDRDKESAKIMMEKLKIPSALIKYIQSK